MLSRAANRMYWFGRYVERVENTANLLNVNTNLVMDLPQVKHIWDRLLDVTGDEENYHSRYSVQNEQNIVKFLLQTGDSSILASLHAARENARTSREVMPKDAWVKINKLHMYLDTHLDKALRRDGRNQVLSQIVDSCQELTGYLAGCMSISDPYTFIRLGRNLERADMTSRILDEACLNLTDPEHPEVKEYEDLLWMSLLMSVSGYQMYRRHVYERLNGPDVAAFLLKDLRFPRAVGHCLDQVSQCCRALPFSDDPLVAVTATQQQLDKAKVAKLFTSAKLHGFIDKLQLNLGEIHNQLSLTWFEY